MWAFLFLHFLENPPKSLRLLREYVALLRFDGLFDPSIGVDF
jgi:hypothetical protein